jgi:(p)ppGpp synthase/HD superfamily hydrolase
MTIQFGMPFINGVAYAADAHNGQVRKGSDVPYISHPLAVAALVLEFGGDEDLAIAGLLHDVIEDCDPIYAERMQETFGGRVYSIVRQLTDGVPDESGEKPEWRDRKEDHLAKLRQASPDVLLVAACDKIHNARSLLADVRRDGLAAFDKFKGGVDGTLWYLGDVAKITRGTPAGDALQGVVEELYASIAP